MVAKAHRIPLRFRLPVAVTKIVREPVFQDDQLEEELSQTKAWEGGGRERALVVVWVVNTSQYLKPRSVLKISMTD